ncbi:MAG: long-chain-fatty-acyl-CoA reductase [Chloroflexi bacterium]|nr:long-chain-fatty-acyl-CoA reductase [Chloroflexota bacterium]
MSTKQDDNKISLPFIIRGQEINSDDLLYQSRDGKVQFHYPDPSPLLDQIILPDPTQLQRDFTNVSVSEIIRFLSEAGKAMTLNNARMEKACQFSMPFSALPPSIVRGSYELIPIVFSKMALRTMVENEIGSKYLDGWVEMPYADKVARRRAYGARTLHFISGNVPVVAALSIARAALIKSDNIVKVAPNDPLTAWAIVGAMLDVDPNHPVTKHFSVVYWPKDMLEFENELIQPRYLEKIISWGGALGGVNSTLNHGSLQASGIDVIALGPKFSISILGSEAFKSYEDIERVAKLTAKDAGSFNMESCGSARFHYVQATPVQAKEYARRLYMHMQKQDPALSTIPKNFPTNLHDELNAARTQDDLYFVVGGEKEEGAVVVSLTGDAPDFFPTHKVVVVIPFSGDPAQLADRIHPSTQTVGIYPETLKKPLRDVLVARGVCRFISIGHTIDYAIGGPFNSYEIMRRACRWILDETYPSKWSLPWFYTRKAWQILKHHIF